MVDVTATGVVHGFVLLLAARLVLGLGESVIPFQRARTFLPAILPRSNGVSPIPSSSSALPPDLRSACSWEGWRWRGLAGVHFSW